ncbi:O-antigen ligase [Novosphingobium sp. Gsoil 351]|uniref:O-antigen ligase family protein n=1 Tax=Novosphingobium sp. Gsoil 351 TaxID=2675225 RepID=UPI001E436C6B|nr:O-antigen ligase family protein [Novosphingobium sp. Gsoil 351]
MILRPLSILACAAGILSLRRDDWNRYRTLFLLVSATIVLVATQLVPLPSAVWHALAGREVVREIDAVAGLRDVWRALSMDPGMTWNALFSLSVPLAVLALAAGLSGAALQRLLSLLLIVGLVSGVLGVLQLVGPAHGPLYFYRVANFDSAVGLFANRNHQAAFLACLFPMLAVHASQRVANPDASRRRTWSALVAGAILIPFLLNAGSRSGLLLGATGLAAAWFLYQPRQSEFAAVRTAKPSRAMPALIAGGALALVGLTVIVTRAASLRRLLQGEEGGENRLQVWAPIARQAWDTFPWGTGFGSFAAVFKVIEPRANLDTSYLNHAHNDWLELFLTGGLAGLLLLAAALAAIAQRVWRAWRAVPGAGSSEAVDFARLGAVLLGLFAIASLVDYPLRTPSLTATAIIALLWLWRGTDHSPDSRGT